MTTMFIHRRAFCGPLLLLLLLAGTALGQGVQPSVVIRNQPKNQTVAVGDPVSLTCGIDRSYNGPFVWRTYSGNTDKQIYYCSSLQLCYPSPEFPSDQYMCTSSQVLNATDSFSLNITAATVMDGARYSCNFPIGDVSGVATVVVIDKPQVSIIEPMQLSGSTIAGGGVVSSTTTTMTSTTTSTNVSNLTSTTVTYSSPTASLSSPASSSLGILGCVVNFGAPNFADPLVFQDRMPQLLMEFDGVKYYSNTTSGSNPASGVKSVYQQGTARMTQNSLSLTVNRPLTKSDIGKEMTCTVYTRNPPYSLSNSVLFKTTASQNWVMDIGPIPDDGLYYIDDVINCTVENEPNAQVRWEPISNPHLMPVYLPSLTITQDMVGENIWKCVASDSYNSQRTEEFTFNVTAAYRNAPGGNDDDEEQRRRIGLGVGLGLGLGIPIIIAIIILVIILKRRNSSPRKSAVKNGKPTPSAASTGYAPLAPEPEHQAPPIYQPRTNAQPGRNTSPVPSEEPSLNRSGHGDLGDVGFKPASLPSRSNSNLNASTERPLISLGGAPPGGQLGEPGSRPSGFADIGGGIPGRAPVPYADSHDSASAVSVPHSTSIRSSSSSLNPSRTGPTYRQPAPRTGQATGV